MTNLSLAQSYLSKATVRLRILPILFEALAFSDVIREAQELVELALKGMLRQVGIEPPHWHDAGGQRAMDDAAFVVAMAARVIGRVA